MAPAPAGLLTGRFVVVPAFRFGFFFAVALAAFALAALAFAAFVFAAVAFGFSVPAFVMPGIDTPETPTAAVAATAPETSSASAATATTNMRALSRVRLPFLPGVFTVPPVVRDRTLEHEPVGGRHAPRHGRTRIHGDAHVGRNCQDRTAHEPSPLFSPRPPERGLRTAVNHYRG